MNRLRRTALWVGLAAVWIAPATPAPITAIVSNVSQGSYTHYLDDLLYTHTGDNRGYGAQHDLAQANIRTEFQAMGLHPRLEPFTYNGATYYNVVGRLEGTVTPDEVVVIGAHYDSAYNPGADDNASGVAGVLEAARVLSQYSFNRTIVFAAFDREEQGLYGSYAYLAAPRTDHIVGMISLDMIAFDYGNAGTARVYANSTSAAWDAALQQALWTYAAVSTTFSGQLDYSDHAPFRKAGIPAALVIESGHGNNPCYHTSCDTVDNPGYIDYAFATSITRGVTGFVAFQAVSVPEPVTVLLVAVALAGLIRLKRRSIA